jgi:hypothetical protein
MLMAHITKMMMLMDKEIIADHDEINDYRDDDDVASNTQMTILMITILYMIVLTIIMIVG